MIKVLLGKPITAHETEVLEIEFREPTPEDVMQIGTPQLLVPGADGESVGIEIRAKLIGQYIVRLAKIPPSAVRQMSLSDFMRCQGVVMGFFSNGDGEA